MLRIRFLRIGKKNAPSFRIVLTEKTAPPKGKFLEILGFYNPRSKETGLKKERILHWLSKGAKPSATVHNLLVRQAVIKGPKIKKKIKKELRGQSPQVEGTVPAVPADAEGVDKTLKESKIEDK